MKSGEHHISGTDEWSVRFRPITDEDMEFLYRVYASTRLEELAATGWNESQIEAFLRMQFGLQQTQYVKNYPDASFHIILIDGAPAGRLYVQRDENEMRIMDIALLPEFRGKGVGRRILENLVKEADEKGFVMSLHVETHNPVREHYKSIGFHDIETRGFYYYMQREPIVGGKSA
jgi:ribosomal protein S18 acetylase RimI-like enzyme